MGRELIALCRIEHNGKTYEWGDPVTQEVAEAHPTAIGYLPPSDEEISKMTKEDLAAELRAQTGQTETVGVQALGVNVTDKVARQVGEDDNGNPVHKLEAVKVTGGTSKKGGSR